MNIIQELEAFLHEFNSSNNEDFNIDSIRVEFSKQHKLKELEKLGVWCKVEKNSSLLSKLKKRLQKNEITSAWRLEKENIYYYNMQDAPQYRKAVLVIFGMKQYHKEPPLKELITKIFMIMKNVSNIDICFDMIDKPNFEALNEQFQFTPYITNKGVLTNTRYINTTDIPMIEKITIYDKAFKNNLSSPLWRIEAKILIPNVNVLALPLYELKEIIDIARI